MPKIITIFIIQDVSYDFTILIIIHNQKCFIWKLNDFKKEIYSNAINFFAYVKIAFYFLF